MTTQTYYVMQSISSGQFLVTDADLLRAHHMTKTLNEATAFSLTELVRYVERFGRREPEQDLLSLYVMLPVKLAEHITVTVVLV